MTITVIHGGQMTGKTFHKEAFCRHYGCARILDGWTPPRRWKTRGLEGHCDDGSVQTPRDGDLILTTAMPSVIAKALPGATIIPIDNARAEIGVGTFKREGKQ